MTEYFIAKKHIFNRKFQSFVSIFGIAISLTVFVVSLSISNGLKKNMLNSLLSLSPHITMEIYKENQHNYKDIIKKLEKYNFDNINPRIETQALIKTNGISTASILIGTDFEKLNIRLVDGIKDNKDLTGILVGEEFMNKLGLNLGDNINIITNETKEIIVRVVGIFKTGFYNYDSDLIILPLETMQILNERGEIASKISINVKNPENIKKINETVFILNKDFEDVSFFRSWSMDNQSLLSAINFEKFVLISILSLIIIISSFSISVILNMVVREKTGDIGILKAMGYRNYNILKIFLLEGIIIGILGILMSLILSPILIKFLSYAFKYFITSTYYIETLPYSISILELFIVYLLSFLLIILSSLIPAYNAFKLNPTAAIKYNI